MWRHLQRNVNRPSSWAAGIGLGPGEQSSAGKPERRLMHPPEAPIGLSRGERQRSSVEGQLA